MNPTAPAIRTILEALYAQSLVDGRDYTVTSGHDSTHAPDSRHYHDEALDIRVHDVAAPRGLFEALRIRLGEGFTVIYESPGTPNAHIHVQVRKNDHLS